LRHGLASPLAPARLRVRNADAGECDVGTETAVPRSEAVGDDVLTKIWQTRRAELCRLERDQHQQTERKGVAEDGIHGHGMHVDMHDGRALARSSSPSGKQIRAGSSLLLFWEVRELRGEGVRPGNGGERLRFGLKRMRTWCTATGRAPRPWRGWRRPRPSIGRKGR
jgi:hypothetical protein